MNPVCAWIQWRLSCEADGARPRLRVHRHAARCPRCSAYRRGWETWIRALCPAEDPHDPARSADPGRPFREAVRASVRGDSPTRSCASFPFRPVLASLALAVLLAAVSSPLAFRVRRYRAVQHLSRGGSGVVRMVMQLPHAIDAPLPCEVDLLAHDMARALRFLADGLPRLGLAESVGAMEEALAR